MLFSSIAVIGRFTPEGIFLSLMRSKTTQKPSRVHIACGHVTCVNAALNSIIILSSSTKKKQIQRFIFWQSARLSLYPVSALFAPGTGSGFSHVTCEVQWPTSGSWFSSRCCAAVSTSLISTWILNSSYFNMHANLCSVGWSKTRIEPTQRSYVSQMTFSSGSPSQSE